MVRAVWRRLGTAYGIFCLAALVVAWVGPRAFAPGARFLLPALPFYAIVAAEYLAPRRRLLVPVVVASAIGLAALVNLFSAHPTIWIEW